jgi:hypothetical protein
MGILIVEYRALGVTLGAPRYSVDEGVFSHADGRSASAERTRQQRHPFRGLGGGHRVSHWAAPS